MATVERAADGREAESAGSVAELMEFWGEGLSRILATVDEGTRARLAEDEVVAGLMLLHDLHPVPLADRVQAALDSVRPYMETHGGDVELLGIEDGVARLRLDGSCSGCGASQSTLENAIETAIEEHAPDLLGLDVEGVAAAAAPRRAEPAPDAEWVVLDGVAGLARGQTTGARGLVIANVAGTLLAYRDACAGCSAPLTSGMLVGGKLTCSSCGATFDLPRAGRGVGDSELQLDPVPLLRNGGPVRVALPPEPRAKASTATCELCPLGLAEDHRHLLHLEERRIVCVCETCWSLHSGDPEYRPPGGRTEKLEEFDMPDDVWAAFQIPIGLTFLLRSTVTDGVVAMYPSPAGATESELELTAWDALVAANPVLADLQPDAEALIVDRTGAGHQYAIVPVDQAYRLVGLIKSRWEGISGGHGPEQAIGEFFAGMR